MEYVKREVKINYFEKEKGNGVKACGEWRCKAILIC
jgi:hypothetical protein